MITKNINLLRFLALYVLAYTFPFPFGAIPGTGSIAEKLDSWIDVVILGIGHNIFGVTEEIHVHYSGSGDTTWHYLLLLSILVFSTVLTYFWNLVRWPRWNAAALNYWLLWYIQLYLAFCMIQYGMVKIMMAQFTELSFQMLIEPYGNSSPMELAWAFFGFSKSYNLIIGLLEVVCAYLLLFRKTRMLGALTGMVIMANVVVVNFVFDIPVKLYAIHILLFLAVVLAPDFKRLLSVILLNKPTDRVEYQEVFTDQKKVRIRRYVLWAFGILVSINAIIGAFNFKSSWGDYAPEPPLYGLYEIEQFVINGNTLEPLLTDTVRWRYMAIDKPSTFEIYRMDKSMQRYSGVVDTRANELYYSSNSLKEERYKLSYHITDSIFHFATVYQNDTIEGKARIWNKKDFPLLNRGFYWRTEYPNKR